MTDDQKAPVMPQLLVFISNHRYLKPRYSSCLIPSLIVGGGRIAARQGWQRMPCPFTESSEATVGSLQKHLPPTSRRVHPTHSHHSPRAALSRWWPAKPPASSTLLRQGHGPFCEERGASRRTAEERGRCGTAAAQAACHERVDLCASVGVPHWMTLGAWDKRRPGGTWQACRSRRDTGAVAARCGSERRCGTGCL